MQGLQTSLQLLHELGDEATVNDDRREHREVEELVAAEHVLDDSGRRLE